MADITEQAYVVHDADERRTAELVRASSHKQAVERAYQRQHLNESGELHAYLLPEPEVYLLHFNWEHV